MKVENIEQIEQLVKIFEKSSMLEFEYKSGDTEIYMSRMGEPGQASAPVIAPAKTVVQAYEEDTDLYITSPIVGTFYAAPSPEAKPFVNAGDEVKPGQVVCILEAMKLMTEIKSEYKCEIEAVLVVNGQKVEYGQPLFKVKK